MMQRCGGFSGHFLRCPTKRLVGSLHMSGCDLGILILFEDCCAIDPSFDTLSVDLFASRHGSPRGSLGKSMSEQSKTNRSDLFVTLSSFQTLTSNEVAGTYLSDLSSGQQLGGTTCAFP